MNAVCWWSKEQVQKLQKRLKVDPVGTLNDPTWKALEASLGMVEIKPEPKPGNLYYVKNHILYKGNDPVSFQKSPNYRGNIIPRIVVIHYTASDGLQGTIDWLCKSQGSRSVSAHLVIARTGVVWQLVPFNLRAWHAGPSEWNGEDDCNSFSIGIENMGWGKDWPEAQIQANIDVIKALKKAYDIEDIVGHDEIAVPDGRKPDPGPNYPWDRVRKETGF